jgi:hypothetical protein
MNTPRNNPRIDPDDPKWTAYVLGELDDAEVSEIERLLETSEEARMLVEELHVAAAALKDELLPLTSAVMLPEQREAIHTEADKKSARGWLEIFPARWAWGLGLAAASVVVFIAIRPAMNRTFEAPSVMENIPAGTTAAPAIAPAALREVKEQEAATASAESAVKAFKQDRAEPAVATVGAVAVAEKKETDAKAKLQGVITDASGAMIPGVSVSVTNAETGVTQTTTSDSSGAYRFTELQPGKDYKVSGVAWL